MVGFLNATDILLVLLILFFGYLGWRQGFILGILSLIIWAGSLLIAFFLHGYLAAGLNNLFDLSAVWGKPAAFILIAFFSIIALSLFSRAAARRIPQSAHPKFLNKVLGILPSLFEGLILAAILAALVLILPLPGAIHAPIKKSVVVNQLAGNVERAEIFLYDIFGEAVDRTLTRLIINSETSETINLGFTIADTPPRPDLEERMLEMVNAERQAANLEALVLDPDLREVARGHSGDMLSRGYFGHITPEGITPFDRLREASVTFLITGENISLAPTLQVSHNGLMNSPSHRTNILLPQFGRVGIGILDACSRGLMVTQVFRN